MELTKFNPTVADLNTMVKESAKVSVTDIHNTTEMDIVKEHRIKIVKARTTIQATGKEYRAEALAMQKAVIAREKELIAIITPEEERLKEIETGAKLTLEREDRVKLLPERKEKLKMARLNEVEDSLLLDMDDAAFASFYTTSLEAKMILDNAEAIKKEEHQEVEKKTEKAIVKNTGYTDFLKKHSYNKVTDVLKETPTHIILYRKVAMMKKK